MRALALLLGLALPLSLAAAPRKVRVGVFVHRPAIFLDAQGRAQGFFVDMLKDVAAREGWELEFVPGTWQEGLDRARTGQLDLLTSVAYNAERDRFLDFCNEPAFTVWSMLLVPTDSGIQSILDVRHQRIGVMKGDINAQHFRNLAEAFSLTCTYVEMGSFEDIVRAIEVGTLDGGVTPSTFGYHALGKYRVKASGVVFDPFNLYFATGEGRNADLLKALDAYLAEGRGKAGSSYQAALDRWLANGHADSLPSWVLPAALGTTGLLVVAVLLAVGFRIQVRRATAEIRSLATGLQRELAEKQRLEAQILEVASAVSATTGETFLHELVRHLVAVTGADLAFVGELEGAGPDRAIRTLSVHRDGARQENFHYPLAGAPCERAVKGELCIIPRDLPQAFPHNATLQATGCQSYVGAPLTDSGGKVLGILAVLHRDALPAPGEVASLLRIFSSRAASELERRRTESARQVLERQMQHAQKLESLGVLAGGIAHDFNNLLTAMLGHMNVAQLKLAPESPALPHLESLERIIHRASELTRQMLAYSGKGRFVVRAYDLNQVVHEVTHLLEVSISKKIALRFGLAEGLPLVEADAAQIQQVIMNLVTNAADAIGEAEGTIRLSTSAQALDRGYLDQVFQGQDLAPGEYVVLEVSDTGCGMTPEVLERIFEPFFTTKLSGRGLGLSATMGILKGHRAGMRIYSEPGRGTTFKLLFPTVAGEAADIPVEAGGPAMKAKGTVLLVDDEEMIRESAAAMLRSMGLAVRTATHGREALDVIEAGQASVDLVLMDLTMPQMDGREAFTAMRRLRPDLPIILSSGYNEQESIQAFTGRGLAAFLQKPYTLRSLEKTVQDVLARRGGPVKDS